MGPNSAMMAASTGTTAATTATTAAAADPGMGKMFMAMQALSALSSIAGGIAGMGAARDEATLMEEQVALAEQEAEIEAAAKAREVRKFQAKQAHTYAASGVTLEGTPVLVLEETLRLGQQEVDAMRKAGQARADLMRRKAQMGRSAGRNAFLTSILGAASEGAQGYMLGKKLGIFGAPHAKGKQDYGLDLGRIDPDGSRSY